MGRELPFTLQGCAAQLGIAPASRHTSFLLFCSPNVDAMHYAARQNTAGTAVSRKGTKVELMERSPELLHSSLWKGRWLHPHIGHALRMFMAQFST